MTNPLENNNRNGNIAGTIFVVLYAMLFVGLFVWGSISLQSQEVQGGVMIDFGTVADSGQGAEDTELADNYEVEKPQNVPQAQPVETQVVEEDEAPEIEDGDIVTDPTVEEQDEVISEPEEPIEEVKPREVNRRALFPGNTVESTSTSQGETDKAEGNQGYIGGTQADNYDGTAGEGGFEPDWNLEGRRPRNAFPRPKYSDDEQGVVVVEIWVDGNGDVTGASYRPKGSTVSAKSLLVAEAIKAAKGVKFDESDQDIQVGTITYYFKPRNSRQKGK